MQKQKLKVAILGGGVAGLSAAHELINRGFAVEVYEAKDWLGGKARSVDVPDTGTGGRKNLPGEHGFRFFPRFYKHVTATMAEIPFQGNKNGVLDNLTETSQILMARFDKEAVVMPARFPRSLKEAKEIFQNIEGVDLGLSEDDKEFFAEKVWQLMTSCRNRRKNEYERIGWWEFLDADNRSEAYRTMFVRGLTRTLVAARAEVASTKTGGDVFLQLMFDIASPGMSSDRILNAPTNEAWINPWVKHLKEQGVQFFINCPTVKINSDKKQITSVTVKQEDGSELIVTADYYISAMPVERIAPLLDDNLIYLDPTLANVKLLSTEVSWMNGSQFYLNNDLPLIHGHAIYIDTPWALTSISQKQFWKNVDLSKYGDGHIKGILSVDVSDWDTPGIIYGKTAKNCSKDEIVKEIWAQLKRSLNVNGKMVLRDEDLHTSFIDPDIEFNAHVENKEPLLVNTVNSWDLRPYSYTQIPNFFLASDYVKTNTDLATMEGANEAAKRAVNNILDASKSNAAKCKIYDLQEPFILKLIRWKDKKRYEQGLQWSGHLPFGFETLHKIIVFIKKII
ncbi:MAG: phytoene dehydrogenase [Bacteroidetes bacterium]|nr:phytoene dehydrogenase [Bacteroidota bacterium]